MLATKRGLSHRTVSVDGNTVFYREAGNPDSETIVLLHGFPSSSHMFRGLIAGLESDFHLVAPDMPGFGETSVADKDLFRYTFDNLSSVIEKALDKIGLAKFFLYVMDYGAPVGYRIAMRRPELISGIISQNGNAYEAGFVKEAWKDIFAYWESGSKRDREKTKVVFSDDVIKWQYQQGVPAEYLERIGPESWATDCYYVKKEGRAAAQMDLFYDYKNNVSLYPQFQEYFRSHRPHFLGVWGKNDPFFCPSGLSAYKEDLPDAEIHFLNTGHFALETHADEIGSMVRDFVKKHSNK